MSGVNWGHLWLSNPVNQCSMSGSGGRIPHIHLLFSGCILPSCSSQQPGKATSHALIPQIQQFPFPKAKVNLFIPPPCFERCPQAGSWWKDREQNQANKKEKSTELLSFSPAVSWNNLPRWCLSWHREIAIIVFLNPKYVLPFKKTGKEKLPPTSSLCIDIESTERETQSTWEVFKTHSCRKSPRMIEL